MFRLNRPYVFDKTKEFYPTYLPGENYSIYINSDAPISDAAIPMQLRLKNSAGSHVALWWMQTLFVAGSVGYHLYIPDFVFPRIADGYYRWIVYDTVHAIEVFTSNYICVDSNCIDRTTLIKFRHNDQLFGVRYDLLPDFYQMFRLPINQIHSIDVKSDRQQYRQSSNQRNLRNSKSFRDIIMTLEFYFGNDEDLSAISAVLEHFEVYMSGNKMTANISQLKSDKVDERSNLSKGTFEAIFEEPFSEYGDFILYGGNASLILNTFVSGN